MKTIKFSDFMQKGKEVEVLTVQELQFYELFRGLTLISLALIFAPILSSAMASALRSTGF